MDSHEKLEIKGHNVDQSRPKRDLAQFRDREIPINFGFLLKSDPFTFVHTMTELAVENNELRKENKRLEIEVEHLRNIFTNGYVNQNLSLNKEEKLGTVETPPKVSEDLIDLTFDCDEISNNTNNNIIVVSNNNDEINEAEEVIEIKNPVSISNNGPSASNKNNFTIRVELVNKTFESQSPQSQHRQCCGCQCQCQARTIQKRRSSTNSNHHYTTEPINESTRRQIIPLPHRMTAQNLNSNSNSSRNISSNSKIVASNSVASSNGSNKGQNKKPTKACVFAMKNDVSPTPSSLKKNKKKSKSRFYKNAFNAFLGRNSARATENANSTTNYESNNRISFPINSISSSQNIMQRPSFFQPQNQPLRSQFSSHRRPPLPPHQFRD